MFLTKLLVELGRVGILTVEGKHVRLQYLVVFSVVLAPRRQVMDKFQGPQLLIRHIISNL